EGAIDGKEGLVHTFGPEWKLDVLREGLGRDWRILECGMKFFPSEALTHTPISATLQLISENDLSPEQIHKVEIRTTARGADILSDRSKYDPNTRETADHSLPYCIAAAIIDRQVTPLQFSMEKIRDPRIRAQLTKIKVTSDPAIEALFPERQRAAVAITLNDGRRISTSLDYPKGHARNPLSDEEIEAKFRALADTSMSEPSQRKLIDAIWNLESARSVRDLLKLTWPYAI
ncbi:MAG TPA: MmgE/PrpD family protein, partial [Candidatus Koribacter sp.]